TARTYRAPDAEGIGVAANATRSPSVEISPTFWFAAHATSPFARASSWGSWPSALTNSINRGAVAASPTPHTDACTPPKSSRTSARTSVIGVCSSDDAGSVLGCLGDRVARCISGSPDQVVFTISRTVWVGQVVVEDCFDFSDRLNRVQLLAQFSRSGQPLHVPAKMLPKLDGGAARIQLVLVRHVRMLQRDRKTLAYRRRGSLLASFQQIPCLVEDPRLPERSTRNHDACAPRLPVHRDRVLGRLDVAVAEHRNLQRVNHRSDLVPARRAA